MELEKEIDQALHGTDFAIVDSVKALVERRCEDQRRKTNITWGVWYVISVIIVIAILLIKK